MFRKDLTALFRSRFPAFVLSVSLSKQSDPLHEQVIIFLTNTHNVLLQEMNSGRIRFTAILTASTGR